MRKHSLPPTHYHLPTTDGFIALVSTLVIAGVVLSVGALVMVLGLSATRTTSTLNQSIQARALANACAERALNQLQQDLSYVGGETVTLGSGSCQVMTVLGSGNINRTIQVKGTVGTVVRKVKIEVMQVNPTVQFSSWREVASF